MNEVTLNPCVPSKGLIPYGFRYDCVVERKPRCHFYVRRQTRYLTFVEFPFSFICVESRVGPRTRGTRRVESVIKSTKCYPNRQLRGTGCPRSLSLFVLAVSLFVLTLSLFVLAL